MKQGRSPYWNFIKNEKDGSPNKCSRNKKVMKK